MANSDTPSGFKVAGHRGGGSVRTDTFNIAYDYATKIYHGDAVVLTSGKVAIGAANSATILGIFDGCSYVNDSGDQIFTSYWPGVALTNTAAVVTAYVYTDKGILFEVQCETSVDYVDATHIGTACDLIATHAGSTVTGQSGQEITVGTTGDAQFVVLKLIDRVGNAAGAHAKVLVAINDSTIAN